MQLSQHNPHQKNSVQLCVKLFTILNYTYIIVYKTSPFKINECLIERIPLAMRAVIPQQRNLLRSELLLNAVKLSNYTIIYKYRDSPFEGARGCFFKFINPSNHFYELYLLLYISTKPNILNTPLRPLRHLCVLCGKTLKKTFVY